MSIEQDLLEYLASRLTGSPVTFKPDGTISDRDNDHIQRLVAHFCLERGFEAGDFAVHMDARSRTLTLISEFTAESYEQAFGVVPVQDDLGRVNCPDAGHVGHKSCGVCAVHNRPRFECGCIKTLNKWER